MGERRAGEERGKTSDLTRSREPATLAVEAMLPLLIRAAVVSGESVLCIGCRAVCTSVLCAPHHRRACAAPIHEADRPARAWRFCGPSTGCRLSRRAVRARACSALFLGTIRAVVPGAVLRRSTPGAQLGRTLWRRQRHAPVAHKSRRLHSEEQPRPDERCISVRHAAQHAAGRGGHLAAAVAALLWRLGVLLFLPLLLRQLHLGLGHLCAVCGRVSLAFDPASPSLPSASRPSFHPAFSKIQRRSTRRELE